MGTGYEAEPFAWPGPGDEIALTALPVDRSGDTLYDTSQWNARDRGEIRVVRRKDPSS